MAEDVNIHKVTDKDKRRAEHIEDRLEKQGMGRDQAEKEALKQAVDEKNRSAREKEGSGS